MSEPQHVQDSIKIGVLVTAVYGPHKGKVGRVTELYRSLTGEQIVWRAFVELPNKTGFFQTRREWLVRVP